MTRLFPFWTRPDRLRLGGTAALILLCTAVLTGCGQSAEVQQGQRAEIQRGDRPNVILIMADDVGYEAFGSYGSEQYDTPHTDEMAREGMRFTHAYSQPLCTPSRVEIMSGRSNIRNYTAFGLLDPSVTTFGHMLQDAGYATAVAGKWQLYGPSHYPERSQGAGTLPGEAGFDEWALWQVRTRPNRYWEPTLDINGELESFDEDTYGPDVTTDFLLQFIEDHQDEPFFAYYPMNLPHFPFVPTPHSESRDQENEQKNFEDMVAYLDFLVGRIIDKVDQLGLSENTLILFTGDNGTHRSLESRLHGRVIEGGKWTTTETGMHVPMIARMPGTVPSGTVNEDLVGFSDVLPTLADLTGAELPDVELDGVSFAPQLRGEPGQPREWLFSYYWPKPLQQPDEFPGLRFAWDKNWKLYSDGRLFHIAEDPAEEHSLAPGEGGAEAERARQKLQQALDSMPGDPMMLMRRTDTEN